MNNLESALLTQQQDLMSKEKLDYDGRIYFETSLENDCLRILMTSKNCFLSTDYKASKYGYTSYDTMRKDAIVFLKSAGYHYRNPLIKTFKKIISVFNTKEQIEI